MENDQDQRQFEEVNNQNIQNTSKKPIDDSQAPINNHNSVDQTIWIQSFQFQDQSINQNHQIDQMQQRLSSNSVNFNKAQINELSKRQQQQCDSCKQIKYKHEKINTEMQSKIEAFNILRQQYEKNYGKFKQQRAKLQKEKKTFQQIKKSSNDNLKHLMELIVNCFQNLNQGTNLFNLDIQSSEYVWQNKSLTFFENYLIQRTNEIHKINQQKSQSLQRMKNDFTITLAQSKKTQQQMQKQYNHQLKKLQKMNEQLTLQNQKLVQQQTTNKNIIIKKQQKIRSLQSNIKSNKMLLNQKQKRLEEIQTKIQELQKSNYNSFKAKQQNELRAEQIRAQEQKTIIQRELYQKKSQLSKAQQQIKKLGQQKQQNCNDYEFLRTNISKRQKIQQQQRQKFKNQIKNKLDRIIKIAQISSRQNRQTINKQFNNLLSSLKEQINKFTKFYDQFWRLEELYYNLSCNLIRKNAQIQLKEALLKQSNKKTFQLIQQIKKLDDKLMTITDYYQKEMEQIKNAFQSKLQTNSQQIESYYQKLIQNKQANTKAMVQIVNEQLTLVNYINKAKFDQYEKKQQRYKKQIKSLEECIKRSEDTYLKQIEAQEQQIRQKDSDLQLFQQKIIKYEGIVLTLNKYIHDLQTQTNQKSRFIFETHKQLENKSLKQLLSQIDEKVPPHSRQLIDLMNCILYQQDQRQKDINSLRLNIRKLQIQKQKFIANSTSLSDQQMKRQRQTQKRSASMEQKIDGLQSQIERLRFKTMKDQQTIEQLKKKLEQNNQQLHILSFSERQSQQQSEKFKNENTQIKSKILSLQKQLKDSQKLSQDKINKLQAFYKEENAKLIHKQSWKEEIKQYDQKIQLLLRQNQSLKAKIKSQQIQSSQITNLKSQLTKISQKYNKTKHIVDEMKVEKSNMQKQYSNLQAQIQSITLQNKQLANRLRIFDQQVKFNQKNKLTNRRTQQLSSNCETVKQAEWKNQKLQAQIKNLKKQNYELQQKLVEAQRQLSDIRSTDNLKLNERKISWNESQNLMKNYEDMIQSLRQEKEILEQQINDLKAKVKRLQGNNKIPKSYISPPKSTLLLQKYPQKINKQEQFQKNREGIYNLIQKSSYFGVNCVLDNHENGRKFLINKIQQIFAGKKLVESKLVYKYTQANKMFAFGSLLPKTELQSESFVFLFTSRCDIFGVISYKKDSISKQAVVIFSINNQKTVTKRPTGDSVTASAITVEFNGDLNIGNGHLRIKSSNRVLAVKEVLGKYFEQYQKKQIFGKDNWRDEMVIELTELQIHRIYMK